MAKNWPKLVRNWKRKSKKGQYDRQLSKIVKILWKAVKFTNLKKKLTFIVLNKKGPKWSKLVEIGQDWWKDGIYCSKIPKIGQKFSKIEGYNEIDKLEK